MDRQRVSTGTEWEDTVGYSRAIRAGDHVRTAGTIATDDDGNLVAPGQPYAQTRHALGTVVDALEELGAGADDVVATRMYVTDMAHQDDVGRAHSEVFGAVRPAATMVEVSGLAAEGAVVEVEAEAIVGD